MILFFHPRATAPSNARFPLAPMALAAVTDGDWVIVDANLIDDPERRIRELIAARGVPELLAVSVMPGPQLRSALPVCQALRRDFPHMAIAWGGWFPSLHADTCLRAPHVDFVVRGQGEDAFRELVTCLRSGGALGDVRSLSWKDPQASRGGGPPAHRHNPERPLRSPSDFPALPYERIPVPAYLQRSFLGRRTGAHQASIGCPYKCSFCAVPTVNGDRQQMESPERTAATLGMLKTRHGMDSVHFYDNNFFLREEHARAQMDALAPLALPFWCEARVDTLVRYSADTWARIKRAGCRMIFSGVESGSNATLAAMHKDLEADKALALAARCKEWDIIPEFSFVLGNPADPEGDVEDTIAYIRRIKVINPATEIILYHYAPIPQPRERRMYGLVEGQFRYPDTLDEWNSEPWYQWATRISPELPWASEKVRRRVRDFETVVRTRFPTVQDARSPGSVKAGLAALAAWRWTFEHYDDPIELRLALRLVDLRDPKRVSL